MVSFNQQLNLTLNFSSSLLIWHEHNKRDLPWKVNSDPYAIWLSEIILQQTRVSQGLPYYLKFLKTFPTVHHLADANIDEVLKLWEGLWLLQQSQKPLPYSEGL